VLSSKGLQQGDCSSMVCQGLRPAADRCRLALVAPLPCTFPWRCCTCFVKAVGPASGERIAWAMLCALRTSAHSAKHTGCELGVLNLPAQARPGYSARGCFLGRCAAPRSPRLTTPEPRQYSEDHFARDGRGSGLKIGPETPTFIALLACNLADIHLEPQPQIRQHFLELLLCFIDCTLFNGQQSVYQFLAP
jgi:hypothetical protein